MRKLVGLMALILLFAPVTQTFAGGETWMMSQVRARHALRKWDRQQAHFWKTFNANMAGTGKQMNAIHAESASGLNGATSATNSGR